MAYKVHYSCAEVFILDFSDFTLFSSFLAFLFCGNIGGRLGCTVNDLRRSGAPLLAASPNPIIWIVRIVSRLDVTLPFSPFDDETMFSSDCPFLTIPVGTFAWTISAILQENKRDNHNLHPCTVQALSSPEAICKHFVTRLFPCLSLLGHFLKTYWMGSFMSSLLPAYVCSKAPSSKWNVYNLTRRSET